MTEPVTCDTELREQIKSALWEFLGGGLQSVLLERATDAVVNVLFAASASECGEECSEGHVYVGRCALAPKRRPPSA